MPPPSSLTRPPGDPAAIMSASSALGSAADEAQAQYGILVRSSTPSPGQLQGKFAEAAIAKGMQRADQLKACLDALIGASTALREYAHVLAAGQKAYDSALSSVQDAQGQLSRIATAEEHPPDTGAADPYAAAKQAASSQLNTAATQAASAYEQVADEAIMTERALAGLAKVFDERGAILVATEGAINRAGTDADGPSGAAETQTLLAQASRASQLESQLDAALAAEGRGDTGAVKGLFSRLGLQDALALAALDPRVGSSDGAPPWAKIASNAATIASEKAKLEAQVAALDASSAEAKALEKQIVWLDDAGQLPWMTPAPLTPPAAEHHSALGGWFLTAGAAILTVVNVAQLGADPVTDGAEVADLGALGIDATTEMAEVAEAEEAAGGLAAAGQGAAAAERDIVATLSKYAGQYAVRYGVNGVVLAGGHAAINELQGKPWDDGMTPLNLLGAPAVAALFPTGASLRAAMNYGAATGTSLGLFDQEAEALQKDGHLVVPNVEYALQDGAAGALGGGTGHAVADHLPGSDYVPQHAKDEDYTPRHAAELTGAAKVGSSYLDGLYQQAAESATSFATHPEGVDTALDRTLDILYRAYAKPALQATDGG